MIAIKLRAAALLFSFLLLSFSGYSQTLADYINEKTKELNSSEELSQIIEVAGDKRLVLLGESTHGTAQYYICRADITKKLISEKDFNFVAVEGDWASIYRLNQYVKGLEFHDSSAIEIMKTFTRWPVWMWANYETASLIEWLREFNKNLPENKKVGFYGMDVYGHWEAMDDLIIYLEEMLPDRYSEFKQMLSYFSGYRDDDWNYARAVASGKTSVKDTLNYIITVLKEESAELSRKSPKEYFRAKQNALVLKNAEIFYTLGINSNISSWNSRVKHMERSIERLMDYYGKNSKGIIWAHNTHVGDARYTDMLQSGSLNIGQLLREKLGRENIFIIGFGTFHGKVIAGNRWGAQEEVMRIPHAAKESIEYAFALTDKDNSYIIFEDSDRKSPISESIPHRAIGVTYSPYNETDNYVNTILPERYDAFIFFRETESLSPVYKE